AVEEDGVLLLATDLGVLRWKPGGTTRWFPHELKAKVGVPGWIVVARDTDGKLWSAIDTKGAGLGLQRFSAAGFESFKVGGFDGSAVRAQMLFADRSGSLWVGTLNEGIYRVHGDDVDHYTAADGLSGNGVYWFAEDREGNVWVSTNGGIDRFRALRALSF